MKGIDEIMDIFDIGKLEETDGCSELTLRLKNKLLAARIHYLGIAYGEPEKKVISLLRKNEILERELRNARHSFFLFRWTWRIRHSFSMLFAKRIGDGEYEYRI